MPEPKFKGRRNILFLFSGRKYRVTCSGARMWGKVGTWAKDAVIPRC